MAVKDKLVTLEELKAAYDASVHTEDIVNNLTSGSTNPVSSGGVYNALVAGNAITPTYDSNGLSSASAVKIGRIIVGTFTIKASALAAGYNSIDHSLGYTWQMIPVASCVTNGTADDTKNFYLRITSSSIQVRASQANSTSLDVYYIGIASN